MHYEIQVAATFRDGDRLTKLVILREPWWTAAICQLADRLCSVTRHRLGCSRIVGPAVRLAERHGDRFELVLAAGTAEEFLRWDRREIWWESDD
ncbi:hypothetical protein [Amycolatopsis viridis]|uniref:Uncharacterized protein n=1 Tax=Amycolatopsis viridis TaxID=185678 RepID=A0ABX0T1G0_9PSEU|nr:hypothetical protein [Amycolatopsis viridis]NIH81700.1 hypothetical protein [Amycolatopsis viridis]